MEEFNAFMHNKFVMFTANVEAKAIELKASGYHVRWMLSVSDPPTRPLTSTHRALALRLSR